MCAGGMMADRVGFFYYSKESAYRYSGTEETEPRLYETGLNREEEQPDRMKPSKCPFCCR